jgi:hypothetical protein
MQTLDIECPSCGEMLELDAGFAGGVCRCSNCGTLMTVPSSAGKAESLTKPTSSASIGAGGMSSMGVPDPGPSRSRRSKKSKKGKGAKGRAPSTTIEAGEYRTASGKVIRVDETTRVPLAESKKKQIRVATTIVFFSIVAAVVAVAVVAIIMITGGPGGKGAGGDVSYNAASNPYDLQFANVVGLPVKDRTVVVVEASEYSGEWLAFVGDMIGVGLSQESAGGEVALIGAGAKPVNFAAGSPSALPITTGEVLGWFEKLPTDAEADVAAAITAALKLEPNTLILVHGDAEVSNIEAWDALLKGKEGLQLHVVHIGNSSPELEGWAGERGGEAVVLSIDQIEYLKKEAAEANAEEE